MPFTSPNGLTREMLQGFSLKEDPPMMSEDTMRLFREQMEAWMKLMNPTEAMKGPVEMQKAWETFFRQQMELFQSASENTHKQIEQMLRPLQQQLEASQNTSREMLRATHWFSEGAGAMFKMMGNYYRMLADTEEQLAKLHRLAAEQVERMQAALPQLGQSKEA
jgi:hypothetical protein